jgi:ABC-type dipeptide/oligopeptide/nickel transport system permease component
MRRILTTTRDSLISLVLLFTAVFFAIRIVPGDPARLMAGISASDQQIEVLRHQMGLDLPIWEQYLHFLVQLGQGTIATSLRNGRPVFEEISERLPYTLLLVTCGMGLAILLSIPMGFIAALRRNSAADAALTSLAVAATSIPAFWFALILIDYVAVRWRLLPSSGAGSWEHVIMPAVVLAATQMGIIMRLVRGSVIEVLHADYIRTARSKGVHLFTILSHHVLRNAAVPAVTVIGLQTGLLLGGAVVTETVFSWPGVGRLLIESVLHRDYPVIQALILVFGIGIILINLVVDLVLMAIDPRLR